MTRRHARTRRREPSIGTWIAVAVGSATVAVIATLAVMLGMEAEVEMVPVESEAMPAEEGSGEYKRDPFAGVLLDSSAGSATASTLISADRLAAVRRYSDDPSWTIAVGAAARSYAPLERMRAVRAETDIFADIQPWGADAREALEGFEKAVRYGGEVEQDLRDARAHGYKFEGVRETVTEWKRLREELARAVESLPHED
ncbi:MAG: hypothetical protein ACYSWX_04370 [Planctomycetota bacterium]|jgi:hypothetical protein